MTVKPGKKYTKIDRGPECNMSGFLMIDNETGEIFGIKAYGVVHKGRRYGTLATAGQWYWGEYGPRKPLRLVTVAAVRPQGQGTKGNDQAPRQEQGP